MIDWVLSFAEALIDFVVTDRLISASGWSRAFVFLCLIATVAFAIWWTGRLMHWW